VDPGRAGGSRALLAVSTGPIPCEWVPYTEIWRDGEVVYAENRADGHREVVMAAVAACRKASTAARETY